MPLLHSLPESDAIDGVESCLYIQEGNAQWTVKLPVQFGQETQNQNGVDSVPAHSKSRLLWSSSSIQEWLNARQGDLGKNTLPGTLSRVTEQ